MLNNYPVANLSKLYGSSVSGVNDTKTGSEGFKRKNLQRKDSTTY
jgi:hypothetical protein